MFFPSPLLEPLTLRLRLAPNAPISVSVSGWRRRRASVIGIQALSEPMRRLPLAEQGRQHPYLDFHSDQTGGGGGGSGGGGDSPTLCPLVICTLFKILTAPFFFGLLSHPVSFPPFTGLFQPSVGLVDELMTPISLKCERLIFPRGRGSSEQCCAESLTQIIFSLFATSTSPPHSVAFFFHRKLLKMVAAELDSTAQPAPRSAQDGHTEIVVR